MVDATECQKSVVNWLLQQLEVRMLQHSDRCRVLELYPVLSVPWVLSVRRVLLDWYLDPALSLPAPMRWDPPLVCHPHSDLLLVYQLHSDPL